MIMKKVRKMWYLLIVCYDIIRHSWYSVQLGRHAATLGELNITLFVRAMPRFSFFQKGQVIDQLTDLEGSTGEVFVTYGE